MLLLHDQLVDSRLPRADANPASLVYEPKISCDRCNKPDIQYKPHYACGKCNDGTFNVCQQCYRNAKGCLHWYGFTAESADTRFARLAPSLPPSQQVEAPHMLVGHRYRKPRQAPVRSFAASGRLMTDEEPSRRLEAGVFCDTCGSFANDCYWKCDTCNEGAWGFCNSCVNQLQHCTHPLLPLTHRSAIANKLTGTQNPGASGGDANTLAVVNPATVLKFDLCWKTDPEVMTSLKDLP